MWFVRMFNWLDARAESKIGFMGAPLLPLLGGLPVWLATRAIAATVILAVGGAWLHGVKVKVRNETEVVIRLEYAQRDARARAIAAEVEATREREADAAIMAVHKQWHDNAVAWQAHADALDKHIAAMPVRACLDRPVVDALRRKAATINGGWHPTTAGGK
jgi:hypothetical protein